VSQRDPDAGPPLLADTSAWHRAGHPAVRPRWSEAVLSERIVTTPAVVIEILYSARDLAELERNQDDLSTFRSIPLTQAVATTAVSAMRDLAATGAGRHRIPLADLLIAAAAQEAAVAVLHYDHDFDRLAQVLDFESRWIAPPGSL
jgi:predicted nucleic acid-binding protein